MANKSFAYLMGTLSIVAVTTVSAGKAFAWGKEGHEAVAMIAEQNLTPEAKDKVLSLLQGDTMEYAATWPDIVKHQKGGAWEHSAPYHFADMPDGQDYLSNLESLPANKRATGDVIRALVKAEDVLRDTNSSAEQKHYAMSFLIHFAGDLHQPLHEGRPDDKGGNAISAVYFGVRSNLHAIWDTLMIENFMKGPGASADPDYAGSKRPAKVTNTADYVAQLRKPSAGELSQWQNSYLLDWSADSVENRASIYSSWNGDSSQYQNQFADYANEKILRAGYRLGAWLNAIAAGDAFQPDKAADLRQHLAQLIGPNYDDSIVLEPRQGGVAGVDAALIHELDCDDD